MLRAEPQVLQRQQHRLHVGLATSESEILEAQKLRYRVFADEMGARLQCRIPGVDRDYFDPYCQHLIVRDETAGRIVGTYRILTPDAANRVGSYYSETEFDITRFHHLRSNLVEIGRSCIDPDYRTGSVITLLWAGLARFMADNNFEYLMGCASISMADGGHNAANIYNALRDKHMADLEYHVFPRNPLPFAELATDVPATLPALLKGYIRAGTKVCGAPAWDPDFNTADLLLLMPMSQLDARYARHFLDR